MNVDFYSLTNALEGTFSTQAATLDALIDLGWLRLMLVDREAELVARAQQEGIDWDRITAALRRDPALAALMHHYIEGWNRGG